MAFKTDWSFLDKISMGAVGAEAVIEQLNARGHQVIELERGCTSNKIWAMKIKRLRIPDLLCLRCGRRIESRAKSKLGIIMSDSERNEERRWFSGLRDMDWVAFIQCYKDAAGRWKAGDTVNLFSVEGMKQTECKSVLGRPKSVYEGAERDREWKCYVPTSNGIITSVYTEPSGRICLRTRDVSGRNYTRRIDGSQFVYAKINDTYTGNAKILSGVVPPMCDCGCTQAQYDFFADLASKENETVYIAVKALGFLPNSDRAAKELRNIANDNTIDNRIRLEAYASMLRLNLDVWEEMYKFAFSLDSVEIETEYVLILGEMVSRQAAEYLFKILTDDQNPKELRAAAVWSLPPFPDTLSCALTYCFVEEQIVADHAIAKIKRHFCDELTTVVLNAFCGDVRKNAICAYMLSQAEHVNCKTVVDHYLNANGIIKTWILYAIGLSPETDYRELITSADSSSKETLAKLDLLWECQPVFFSKMKTENIAFLEQQK